MRPEQEGDEAEVTHSSSEIHERITRSPSFLADDKKTSVDVENQSQPHQQSSVRWVDAPLTLSTAYDEDPIDNQPNMSPTTSTGNDVRSFRMPSRTQSFGGIPMAPIASSTFRSRSSAPRLAEGRRRRDSIDSLDLEERSSAASVGVSKYEDDPGDSEELSESEIRSGLSSPRSVMLDVITKTKWPCTDSSPESSIVDIRSTRVTSNDHNLHPDNFSTSNSTNSEQGPIGSRFMVEKTNNPSTFGYSIQKTSSATTESDTGRNQVAVLSHIANSLQQHYNRTGKLSDLKRAINTSDEALAETPIDDPNRGVLENGRAISYQLLFKSTRNLDDLMAAINASQNALKVTPIKHSNRVAIWSNLGNSLQWQFERTGTKADLDQSISVTRKALAAASADHKWRSRLLTDLGNRLQMRYDRYCNIEDLKEAISSTQEGLDLTPQSNSDRATILNNLASSLLELAKYRESVKEVDNAIQKIEEALDSISLNDERRKLMLNNHAAALDLWLKYTQSTSSGLFIEVV
jgi:tetratricopeptide (TPR) repeat protein